MGDGMLVCENGWVKDQVYSYFFGSYRKRLLPVLAGASRWSFFQLHGFYLSGQGRVITTQVALFTLSISKRRAILTLVNNCKVCQAISDSINAFFFFMPLGNDVILLCLLLHLTDKYPVVYLHLSPGFLWFSIAHLVLRM